MFNLKNDLRKKLLILCMLLFAAPAFCGSVNLFTNARPDMTASVDLSACLKRDLRAAPFILDSRFSADFKELYFDCGSALQDQKFDFTTNAFYMPTFLEKFRAGLGFGYHFYRYFNEFSENDILFSLRFCWCKTSFFNWSFTAGFLLKNSLIDAMAKYKSSLFTNSYFLDLRFDWNFTPQLKAWCSVSSIDYYDYPLIGTPFFKGGLSYKFIDNVSLDLSLSFKFVDMITSAVYLNECILKTGVKVYF